MFRPGSTFHGVNDLLCYAQVKDPADLDHVAQLGQIGILVHHSPEAKCFNEGFQRKVPNEYPFAVYNFDYMESLKFADGLAY